MKTSTFTLVLTLAVQATVRAQVAPESLVRDLHWRNIGPANMAGRISDIEAVESNPSIVFVGAASGGVWKSVNADTTWEPVFEQAGTPNIGDIAVFQPNPNIVWVGTGEACTRNRQVPIVPAGTYRVRLTVNGRTHESTIVIREDPDAEKILTQVGNERN